KVKNPDFLKGVSSICNKEEHLIAGYKNVKDMGGGYMEWVKNKFPVKSSLGKKDL
ncbi:hypothetical protein HN51_062860, partial [Arachis hypogaea]